MIVVSALVAAEVRPRSNYAPGRYDVIRDLFFTNRPYLKMVGLSPRIADLATAIGGEHNAITVPDAIHIATAWAEQVGVFYTHDGKPDRERRRSGQLLFYDGKIGQPPLKIELPVMPENTQLGLPEPEP